MLFRLGRSECKKILLHVKTEFAVPVFIGEGTFAEQEPHQNFCQELDQSMSWFTHKNYSIPRQWLIFNYLMLYKLHLFRINDL
jgi:hypothetical protein